MIRINLLEGAHKRRRRIVTPSSGASLTLVYLLVILLEGGGLYYWSIETEAQLATQRQLTNDIQKKVQNLQGLKSQKEELEKKTSELVKQADIFDKLRHDTDGPSNVLMYLSYVLTPPSNSSERVVHEQIGWNTEWDTDRAWFTEFKEMRDSRVHLMGEAVSQADVDEVLRRIRCSVYFQHVSLAASRFIPSDGKKPPMTSFRIEFTLNYDPDAGKKPPEQPTPTKTTGISTPANPDKAISGNGEGERRQSSSAGNSEDRG